MGQSIIILDLDNCIANDEWRLPLIAWHATDLIERYHDYHMASIRDALGNHDLLDHEHAIVVMTSRPARYRQLTRQWLRDHQIAPLLLFMKEERHGERSVEVKRNYVKEMFDLLSIGQSSVIMAYDDRPDVVEMYRALGLPATVRAIHDKEAWRDDPLAKRQR